MSVRMPAVAGTFYPSDPVELAKTIDGCYLHRLGPGKLPPAERTKSKVVAVVSPHAGYDYSGPVAAHSYLHVSSLKDPEIIVVVAPNHYGIGSGVSTFRSGFWKTPLGSLRVDGESTEKLVKEAGVATFDPEAQSMEHSLEVQLPFLQKLYGDSVPLVPVSLLFQDIRTAKDVAKGLADVVERKKAVIVASSDLTHYEPSEVAAEKDHRLLDKVSALDVEGFYRVLESYQVSACGYGAIATVMRICQLLGLKQGELLKYSSSGETTGDNLQVVGYGAVRFT